MKRIKGFLRFGDVLFYLLGGAIYAAILGASSLSKEERDGTAEFLYTHPLSG